MKFPRSKRFFLFIGILSFAVFILSARFLEKPRVLELDEVPIVFWAWRTDAPTAADLQKAFAATKAKTLFLRTGQFDVIDGSVRRIRPVTGTIPAVAELHLVYNGTRKFLREWDEMATGMIAESVAASYIADVERARGDHAEVTGLQLDLDIPERLLPRYAQMLARLRELLPSGTRLSITGLPSWMASDDIRIVLANVDFWIPQCYGSTIPTGINQKIPISLPSDIRRTVGKARRLKKPFYAGLSAYGYAILYAKDGSLSELRGDIDPALASQNASLELVETGSFNGVENESEMRYVYRAKSDTVLDGLIIQPGETLVFDVPNAASLRAAARAVRENAGDSLLGICVFRLPVADDKTNLGIAEIAAALTDTRTIAATALTLETLADGKLKLSAKNTGTASTILTDDALTIDLYVPAGAINGVSGLTGFTAFETLCGGREINTPHPCSPLRANVVRLKSRSWRPGLNASVIFTVKNALPESLTALVTTHIDDGKIRRESFELNPYDTRKTK